MNDGYVDQDLASQIAGPLNHARWLTLAIRLLQLYTRTEDPSPGLIVTYIQQVYVPSWFHIKSHPHFTADPSNMFMQMRRVVVLSDEDQSIIKPVVQRNAYFAHPSTMLCAGLASEESSVRRKAVTILQDIRKKPPKPTRAKVLKGVRKFSIPPLQWDSGHWWDTIDWKATTVHQPAILKDMTDAELERAKDQPVVFPGFPCHTRSVERAVKLVTEVTSQVEGEDARHGQILSVLASKESRKDFKSKKYYEFKAE